VGAEWALREWVRLAANYRHRLFSVRGELSAETRPTATAAVAATWPYANVVAGGLVTYTLRTATTTEEGKLSPVTRCREGDVARAECAVGYVQPALEVTAYTTSLGRVLGCNAFWKVDRRTSVALDARFDTTKLRDGAPTVEAGVQYMIDSAAAVKAKVNTDCVVNFSYVHQLSKYAKAVLSGSVAATNLSASGAHSFGFSLVLSD
jgi:hypothetical protein